MKSHHKEQSSLNEASPIVSVCLCTYNGEKYLSELLSSLVSQTRKPDEIVVFDDCSKDGTIDIVRNFVSNNPEIQWIVKTSSHNQGWMTNFRNCLKEASGDVIFLCDQDDIWLPDKIDSMLHGLASNPNAELLVSNYDVLYEDGGEKVRTSHANNGKIRRLSKLRYYTQIERPGCTFAVKKSLLTPFFVTWRDGFPHDALLWRIAFFRKSLYLLNKPTIVWRRHSGAATNSRDAKLDADSVTRRIELLDYYYSCVRAIHDASPAFFDTDAKLVRRTEAFCLCRLELVRDSSLNRIFPLVFRYSGYYQSVKAIAYDFVLSLKCERTRKAQK